IHIPDNLPRAAPGIETTIFRFLQEALTNIFKHAKAKNVTIRLWLETSNPSLPTLNAQVTDDGIGFDPSNPTSPTGLGIAGMRERSLINGGSFSIQSSPNQGTKLSLSLPFIPHPSQSQPQ
ncbi:MAG: ATP-binding protein, partial [Chthoniobacterales bacterium]|nr:ATP-binding protein [Chthoniobacterales bacterium]